MWFIFNWQNSYAELFIQYFHILFDCTVRPVSILGTQMTRHSLHELQTTANISFNELEADIFFPQCTPECITFPMQVISAFNTQNDKCDKTLGL